MGRLEINPEWAEAPYELRFGVAGVFRSPPGGSVRFRKPPPVEVWADEKRLREWVRLNFIPKYAPIRDVVD